MKQTAHFQLVQRVPCPLGFMATTQETVTQSLCYCFFSFNNFETVGIHWHPTPVLCLENPMDGGAWQAAVHGVARSWTRLSDFTFTFHYHALEKEMATHSSVLAWRIPGKGEHGGCHLWGRVELDTTEVTQQQQGSIMSFFSYLHPSLGDHVCSLGL